MIENFKRLKSQPPSLLSLLTLELEAFFELEKQQGRVYKYIDDSDFSPIYFDISIRVLNHHGTCVARFFHVSTASEIVRGKLLAVAHILNQLELITINEFNRLFEEIENNYPAEFF